MDDVKKEFLSNSDLERMGIRNASTSRNLQWKKKDPLPFYKVGKSTRYSVKDVQKYLAQNKIECSKL